MLDFRIHTFLALCRHMNYTRAAEELHITQPSVTQHIKLLQDTYRVKLFEYRNQTLVLTLEGEMLRDAMITFYRDEQKLREDLTNIAQMKVVRFGVSETFGEFELPEHLATYLNRHPERRVYVIVNDIQSLLKNLDDGILDFLLIESFFDPQKYSSIPWSTQKFICFCSPDYILPTGVLSISDLFEETLILLSPGFGTREILTKNLECRNYSLSNFHRINEISSIHLLKNLAIYGCGIAFAYKEAVKKELADGTLREIQLTNFDVFHDFSLIWRKGSIIEPLIKRMYVELQAPNAIEADHELYS